MKNKLSPWRIVFRSWNFSGCFPLFPNTFICYLLLHFNLVVAVFSTNEVENLWDLSSLTHSSTSYHVTIFRSSAGIIQAG
jgi:hypothetical protein